MPIILLEQMSDLLPPRQTTPAPDSGSEEWNFSSNRVFYNRDAGLVTSWYLAQRCEEESYRAERYDGHFAVLFTRLVAQGESTSGQQPLRDWFKQQLRKSDIVAYLGEGRYVALLPETKAEEAGKLSSRLLEAVPTATTGIASYPQDGKTFLDLMSAAERRAVETATRAA